MEDTKRSACDAVAAAAEEGCGVIARRRGSPALLLALLGMDAMRRLRAAHDAYALTPRQFHVLGLLQDRGGLGQRDLVHLTGLDPSVLVATLNPLEAEGLLIRRRSAADRRCHLVELTEAGRARLAAAEAGQQAAEDVLLAALTPAQRDELRALLLTLDAAEQAGRAARGAPVGAGR